MSLVLDSHLRDYIEFVVFYLSIYWNVLMKILIQITTMKEG